MSFLIQQIDGVGVTLREVRENELRIGRGTNAQVRSENPAVALEHAVIRPRGDGWEVVDLGSITGTYVSGAPVESAVLARGDVIAAGDLKLTVQSAEPRKPLFLRLERTEARARRTTALRGTGEAAPAEEVSAGAVAATKIDYARAYRLRRALLSKGTATVLATLVAAGAMATVAGRGRLDAFAPGSLSTAHAGARLPDGSPLFAGDDCSSCHQPFAGPSDALCQECHERAFHQASMATVGECTRCHAEHRSLANLAAVHHAECLGCHRDLSQLGMPTTVAASVTGFVADHPQLTLAVDRGAVTERMTVDAAIAGRVDARGLKFNHECHLTGKCRARPPTADDPRRVEEDLDCTACHAIGEDRAVVPLTFETACARCHALTFDNRFPPVPHGITLDAIAGVIANAYAGNREMLTKSPQEVARIFSRGRRDQPDVGSATVRNAQRVLRVRCEQCHEIIEGRVEPVSVTRRWFAGMKTFDHATHLGKGLETDCETCHAAAATSRSAADVLMPGIAECRTCHRDAGSARTARLGGCVTCHYYHMQTALTGPGWTARAELASTRPDGAARTPAVAAPPIEERSRWKEIMTGLILFIVVLAAAVILWSRMRRPAGPPASLGLAERSAEPRPAAPARPAPPPAATPAPPAPPAPPKAPSQPTVAIELPKPPPPPAGGTVVVQWVGSLVGVEGPYAGRKIPIDADGFYIGRDAEMATVVVDDSRVSRRHVWIGVRDGKVMAVEQGSTNGTFLNTVGSAPITEVELKEGDILILADNAASFRYEP